MNIAVLRGGNRIERIRIYPGSSDPAAVQVKYLSDDERKQVADLVEVLCGQGREREEASRVAFGRVAVQGFEGIFDGKDEIPFTEENLDFLMINVLDFRRTVLEAATTLQRAVEKN